MRNLFKYKLFLFFISIFLFTQNINASTKNTKEELIYKSEYLLGPGDILYLSFKGLEIFDNNYSVESDGYVNLPELGMTFVKNKTLKETKNFLEEEYSKFIKDPDINLKITSHRPVVVTLRGEVNQTGLFKLNYEKLNNQNQQFINQNQEFNVTGYQKSPRLFDLIKLGNGITQKGDLSDIQVIRNNSTSQGGGKIKTKVNLLALIEEGDQTQNIELRDGDDVFVPKSNILLLDQIIGINKSNLTPSEISVFVNGNVSNKGRIVLPQGTSLFEAIGAAGGVSSMSGNIEFVRLKNDGINERRIIPNNKSALKGTPNNPILLSGDLIFVKRNLIGKTNKFITEYTAPLINSYGVYKIFD